MGARLHLPWQTKRRARNRLVDPGRQLRMPLYLIGATLVYGALCIAWAVVAFGGVVASTGLRADDWLIVEQAASLLGAVAAAGAIYIVLVCGICIVHTHHMIGPVVAFRRQVEALKNGDYTARSSLRDGDAFAELARDLNELAEALELAQKEASGGLSSS